MKKLSEDEFNSMMTAGARDVTELNFQFIDIWPYVDAIPPSDFKNESLGDVELVYRSGDDRFDFVHVKTETKNVYLLVIVDLKQRSIHGHHLLDLNALYGLSTTPSP